MPSETGRGRASRPEHAGRPGRGPQASAEIPPRPRRVPHLARFTPEEWAEVCARAEACGLRPARYVRETALGATPRARRHQAGDAIIRELLRLGIALDRLVTSARTSGLHAEVGELTATLDEVNAAVRRLE